MNILIDILKVVILGIVEGVTEFLPVSSTGHLIIVDEFVKLEPASFANTFMVIIQLGAILAVIVMNFNKLFPFSKRNLTEKDKEFYKNSNLQTKAYMLVKKGDRDILSLWSKILVAIIPAAILGLLFDDIIDKYLFHPVPVAIALIFYGLVIIVIENRKKDEDSKIHSFEDLSYMTAFKIGVFQCLALVPGTSRSASTIIGGLLLGADRLIATEFSFYLAIPTMIGATLLKVIKNVGAYTSYQWFLILLGSVVSYFVAYLAINKFVSYIKKHDFKVFGYYRIILGILVIVVLELLK